MSSEPTDIMAWALEGHPDDVRTVLGLCVVLAATAKQIDLLVDEMIGRYGAEEAHIRCARAFDGMDGEDDVPKLRAALDVVTERAGALFPERLR